MNNYVLWFMIPQYTLFEVYKSHDWSKRTIRRHHCYEINKLVTRATTHYNTCEHCTTREDIIWLRNSLMKDSILYLLIKRNSEVG